LATFKQYQMMSEQYEDSYSYESEEGEESDPPEEDEEDIVYKEHRAAFVRMTRLYSKSEVEGFGIATAKKGQSDIQDYLEQFKMYQKQVNGYSESEESPREEEEEGGGGRDWERPTEVEERPEEDPLEHPEEDPKESLEPDEKTPTLSIVSATAMPALPLLPPLPVPPPTRRSAQGNLFPPAQPRPDPQPPLPSGDSTGLAPVAPKRPASRTPESLSPAHPQLWKSESESVLKANHPKPIFTSSSPNPSYKSAHQSASIASSSSQQNLLARVRQGSQPPGAAQQPDSQSTQAPQTTSTTQDSQQKSGVTQTQTPKDPQTQQNTQTPPNSQNPQQELPRASSNLSGKGRVPQAPVQGGNVKEILQSIKALSEKRKYFFSFLVLFFSCTHFLKLRTTRGLPQKEKA
jgi:hypothetical protein